MTSSSNRKTYRIDGVDWQKDQNELPQATLSARANDGEKLAIVMPDDWNKPIQADGNAVLMSRSIANPKWQRSTPMNYRDAVRKGTDLIKDYQNDKQIAAMKAETYDPKMGHAIRSLNRHDKPVKLLSRKGRERMMAATELYQDSAKSQENKLKAKAKTNGQDWDMEM
ncbi:hypothetical protein [Oceaniradius stylonematis]|uniref:hypothetical protein n=1 Tax=Oceaniradius stylonematis TaxID=2184161 RepID=UPI00273FA016|nr:hypothetical protein [Oceaniradius stylonematis]